MIKKKPLRKCCGCKELKEKSKLIRVVRNDEGYYLDKTSKANGRGAYICNNIECLALAEKTRGLERSFKTNIPKEIYEQLKSTFDN